MEGKELLRRLSEASGISGQEGVVREILVEELRPLADEVKIDQMGNVIALKRGDASKGDEKSPGRLLLTAHTDEIGLVVSGFWEGFLRVHPVGGFDRRALLGQEVVVHGRKVLPGVIGARPPHLGGQDVPQWKDILVDVGMSSDDDLRDLVRIGDPITLRGRFGELMNDKIFGKAFDDRSCVVAIVEALRILQDYRHRWDVIFLGAVQEEIGHKGAFTGGYSVFPDLGIALDVGFATQPGVGKGQGHEAGKGPMLALGPAFHRPLVEELKTVADRWNIPHQQEVITGPSGTDAWALQVIRSGIPTALISLPLRSMHTAVETIAWSDVESAARWLAQFAAGLSDDSREKMAIRLPEEVQNA